MILLVLLLSGKFSYVPFFFPINLKSGNSTWFSSLLFIFGSKSVFGLKMFISWSSVVALTSLISSVVLLTSSKLSISLLVSSGTIFLSPALSSISITSGTWFLESASVLLTMTSMFWSLGGFRTTTSMSSSLGVFKTTTSAPSFTVWLTFFLIIWFSGAISMSLFSLVTSESVVSKPSFWKIVLEALDSSWPGFLMCSQTQLKKTKINWVGVF